VSATQLVPGIHEVLSPLSSRSVRQWICVGERVAIVDTGIAGMVAEAVLPALDPLGLQREQIEEVIVTHADVDHFGGDAELVAAVPGARLWSHSLDAPLISSFERIAEDRYGWYRGVGLDYPEQTWEWLQAAAGDDTAVTDVLTEGDLIELGGLTLEVLHLPGHSPGHVGVLERETGVAIVADAAMGRGFLARDGRLVGPPPYGSVADYRATARRLLALAPSVLATSHFPVMTGADAGVFLHASLAFVDDLEDELDRALRERPATVGELLARCDAALGPFLELPLELARSIGAHLEVRERAGTASRQARGTVDEWVAA
jgi:glyoxylase-like metal-dependent hydrolase (beta-lactamase superfamily II)